MSDKVMRCDVAIVGSGPGGAVTGALLAEAGFDVIMIEAGKELAPNSSPPFSTEEMETKYRNGGLNLILGNPKMPVAEGSCVGGGSEVNSGLYNRLPDEVLDSWQRKNDLKLTQQELSVHFDCIDKELNVSELPFEISKESKKLKAGADKLNWKSLEVPKWYKYEKAENGWNAEKQTMTKTYIPRFKNAGGKILAETNVLKVERKGNGVALVCENKSHELRINADHVFICAGAIQTPALLQRSGIKQNIGVNFQVHPYLKIAARFKEPVNTFSDQMSAQQVKEFTPRYSFGCSVSSKNHLAIHMLDHPDSFDASQWDRYSIFYSMIKPEGTGTIRSVPFLKDPVVSYKFTDHDFKTFAEAIRKLSLLLLEAGATELYPGIKNVKKITSEAMINRLPNPVPAKTSNLVTMHLFASCAMGENKKVSAVNSYGKVHDKNNIYVNDSSILCTAIGVNPQATVMAVARRNALAFIDNHKKR